MEEVFTYDNPSFKIYAFYSAILIVKVLLMAPLTSIHRILKKKYISPEDLPFMTLGKGGAEVGSDDPGIARVRRAHLNDLENIPVFLLLTPVYLLTHPAVAVATNLIRVFTYSRIFHTIVYAVWVIPQPARALSWGLGYAITIYMAICVFFHYI